MLQCEIFRKRVHGAERWTPTRGPWRSKEETLMIKRLALWWYTSLDHNKPSARSWAKELGVSHTWLQKLVWKFETDPDEVRQLQAHGDPTLEQLNRAKDYTQRMRDQGGLRSRRCAPGNRASHGAVCAGALRTGLE